MQEAVTVVQWTSCKQLLRYNKHVLFINNVQLTSCKQLLQYCKLVLPIYNIQ